MTDLGILQLDLFIHNLELSVLIQNGVVKILEFDLRLLLYNSHRSGEVSDFLVLHGLHLYDLLAQMRDYFFLLPANLVSSLFSTSQRRLQNAFFLLMLSDLIIQIPNPLFILVFDPFELVFCFTQILVMLLL